MAPHFDAAPTPLGLSVRFTRATAFACRMLAFVALLVSLPQAAAQSARTVSTSGTFPGNVGVAFSLQLVAPSATDFAAHVLPPGLTLAPDTGLISGIPEQSGSFPLTLASNDDLGTNTIKAAIISTSATLGAFALADGSKDPAFVVTLPPGPDTAQTTSKPSPGSAHVACTTGVALVNADQVLLRHESFNLCLDN